MAPVYYHMSNAEFRAHVEKIQKEAKDKGEAWRMLREIGYTAKMLPMIYELHGTLHITVYDPGWNTVRVP